MLVAITVFPQIQTLLTARAGGATSCLDGEHAWRGERSILANWKVRR